MKLHYSIIICNNIVIENLFIDPLASFTTLGMTIHADKLQNVHYYVRVSGSLVVVMQYWYINTDAMHCVEFVLKHIDVTANISIRLCGGQPSKFNALVDGWNLFGIVQNITLHTT